MKRLENGKYEFNINEFKTGSIAVYCINNEEIKAFSQYLSVNGVTTVRKEKGLFGTIFKVVTSKEDMMNSLFKQGWCNKAYHRAYTSHVTIPYRDFVFIESAEPTRFITHSELNERGFKTGDIIIEKDGYIGIVYNDWVSYINNNGGWDDIPYYNNINFIIKVEDIIPDKLSPAVLSKLLTNPCDSLLEELDKFKLQVVEAKEDIMEVTVYKVEFTPNGKLYDFLAHDTEYNRENIKAGSIVECNTKNGSRKYAKVRHLEKRVITKKEFSSEYRFCRPVK